MTNILNEIMNNYPTILFDSNSLEKEDAKKFTYSILGLNEYEQETVYYLNNECELVHSELTAKELFNSSLYGTFNN